MQFKKSEHSDYFWIWIFCFFYTVLMALLVQFVGPKLLPEAHFGNGLFIPDAAGFHGVAVEKATEISAFGWEAWELYPEQHSPAGIASFFYVLFTEKPYSMIPWNAVLHALAACILLFILRRFTRYRPAAMAGTLVFVLNPAAFEWTTQLHRDGAFIAGNFMQIAAVLMLVQMEDRKQYRHATYSFVLFIAGTLFLIISRTYWIFISTVMYTLLLVILILWWSVQHRRRLLDSPFRPLAIGVLMVMIVLQTASSIIPNRMGGNAFGHIRSPDKASGRVSNHAALPHDGKSWKSTPWLPAEMDDLFFSISSLRRRAVFFGGNSLLDGDRQFESAVDLLQYLPRALQIGLFSPFPSMWFKKGSSPTMSVGRIVIGLLMVFFYFCMLIYALKAPKYWKRLQFWIITAICVSGILLFAVTYPNIGTLVRLRHGFHILIVCMGFSWFAEGLLQR